MHDGMGRESRVTVLGRENLHDKERKKRLSEMRKEKGGEIAQWYSRRRACIPKGGKSKRDKVREGMEKKKIRSGDAHGTRGRQSTWYQR
jgi:hypothetical protein